MWIDFSQLLSFHTDGLIHHNFYIGVEYFEVVVNDNSWCWFGCWVHSISSLSSFDFDVTGFSFVHGMYLVQELDNRWVFSVFSSLGKSGQIKSPKIWWISYVCPQLLELMPVLLHKLLHKRWMHPLLSDFYCFIADCSITCFSTVFRAIIEDAWIIWVFLISENFSR